MIIYDYIYYIGFKVVIREDLKVLPFIGITGIAKTALSLQLF